jgi:hypothetical protein
MISKSIVLGTGGIRKTRVQTLIQLVGRHMYAWDPYRKKIPEEEESLPINSKERSDSTSMHCVLFHMCERR